MVRALCLHTIVALTTIYSLSRKLSQKLRSDSSTLTLAGNNEHALLAPAKWSRENHGNARLGSAPCPRPLLRLPKWPRRRGWDRLVSFLWQLRRARNSIWRPAARSSRQPLLSLRCVPRGQATPRPLFVEAFPCEFPRQLREHEVRDHQLICVSHYLEGCFALIAAAEYLYPGV